MNFVRVLIMSLLLSQSCSFVGQASREEIRPAAVCGIEGFTSSSDEHIIDEITKLIIVRAVKGKITNEQGGWPTKWPILFEIRRTEGASETIKVYADNEGKFSIPDVAAGSYCFKATVDGWQSVIGIIKVDKKANPRNSIQIVLKIGV